LVSALRRGTNGRVHADRLPSILVNTMPKSGSIYLSRMIASTLAADYSLRSVAHGFFPTYFMIPDALERVRRGNIVRQEHFDASPINLFVCGRYLDRMVLHVRDPRGATLSWAHWVNHLLALHPTAINATIHQPPDDFLRWSLHRQLDWHIDRHLVSLVAWLRQWIAQDGGPGAMRILWTTYDEIVTDESGLVRRILRFYGIAPERFPVRPPAKTADNHFRSGNPDEWKTVLTAAQQARCLAIIGRDVLDHFGWSAD
jgi:hypothetical protein